FGTSNSVRVDHSHIALTVDGKQMTVGGCVYGVMDHSVMDLAVGSTNNGVFEAQGNCGGDSSGQGNGQWAQSTALGSANFWYTEDSTFNGGTGGHADVSPIANDCSSGGRFAYRHNIFNGISIQTHATGHAGDDRQCRAYEIYQNTFANGSGDSTTSPNYD